jgi:hypothetical protein
MSLKKTGKSQNAFSIRIFPINADSQKTPAECRFHRGAVGYLPSWLN